MIPYIGGKSYLASWIISNFPEEYQTMTYCEVFGGGGWVLFKKEPSYVETYNDLNKNLVNLFRVIRDKYKEFSHRAEWALHSREMFIEATKKLKDDKFLTNVERAIYYALKQVQSFSGKGESWGYKLKADKVSSNSWLSFLKKIEIINSRLKKVQIECLDFEKVIEKYDSKNTLFYLDPPYVDCEHYYKTSEVDFTLKDHKRLATILKKIQGKFVLSYYKHDLIDTLYKKYDITVKNTVKHSAGCTRYTNLVTKPKSVELLIKNY